MAILFYAGRQRVSAASLPNVCTTGIDRSPAARSVTGARRRASCLLPYWTRPAPVGRQRKSVARISGRFTGDPREANSDGRET